MSNIEGFTFGKEGFFDFNPIIEGAQTYDINILKDNITQTNDNIINYNNLNNSINSNPTYNNLDLPDKTDMVKTTLDVRKQDINALLLQQNYIYIVGSITCATLLIAAIVIGKNK